MHILGAEFVRSAAGAADFPRDPLPQIAMVGRSNVGKSTLINALARTRLARTSAAPGKTRLINIYRVQAGAAAGTRFYLVDLPGYGYARGGDASRAGFDQLVAEYFVHPAPGTIQAGGTVARHRPGGAARGYGPAAVLHIVDARHPGLEADVAAMDWLRTTGRPVVAVASKIDKLSQAERRRATREWTEALNVPIVPISATTGEGLKELWTQISRLLNTPVPRSSGPTAPTSPASNG
jgi:GTP-binding protein